MLKFIYKTLTDKMPKYLQQMIANDEYGLLKTDDTERQYQIRRKIYKIKLFFNKGGKDD